MLQTGDRYGTMALYRSFGKRICDVVSALIALVVMSPILLVLALFVRIKLGSPIIFRQKRPGLHGRPFTFYKFRSMSDARDENGVLLPDDQRLSRAGRLMRSLSLDELPQFWNILKGDMSMVGPRPLLMEYMDRYTPEQARRHDVRPGITGWAQVNGRNELSWEKKFDLDVWYTQHQSLTLDLRILALTLWRVLRRDGISSRGHATMPEFFPNKE